MKILVFGAGAVGSAVGGFLQLAGNEVTLYGNPGHLDVVEREGLFIDGILGENRVRTGVCRDLKEVDPDLVIITVKSYDTARAAAELKSCDNGRRLYLHLQNGIGNYEILSQYIDPVRLFSGMIIIGFTLPVPGRVTVTVYGGDIRIGQIGKRSNRGITDLVALFADLPLKAHPADHIESYLWSKLLYNASLNPLGAILGVNYGRLKNSETLAIISDVIDEVFSVARACSVPLFWEKSVDYYNHLLNDLLPPTADHRPSMLVDLEQGKRTEIDFLNGAVCRLGRTRGLATPVNNILVRQIRYLEQTGGHHYCQAGGENGR